MVGHIRRSSDEWYHSCPSPIWQSSIHSVVVTIASTHGTESMIQGLSKSHLILSYLILSRLLVIPEVLSFYELSLIELN